MDEDECAGCTQGIDAAREQQAAMIRDHGFMFQAVGGGEGTPGFVYTIGLAQRGLPEFIFVGSCQRPAVGYLEGAIDAAMAGTEIVPGLVPPETGINPYQVPAWVLTASDKLDTHAFGVRRQLEIAGKPDTATLLQIVMPDMSGRFPWEPGYDWVDQQIEAAPPSGRA